MASLRAHLGAWMVRRNVRNRLGAMEDVGRIRAVLNGATFPDPPGVRY